MQFLDSVPEKLLDCEVSDVHAILGGATVISLEGVKRQPLFVSTLLHGNEHTGFLAFQKLYKDYLKKKRRLPRDMILFLGNTLAASKNKRFLEGQKDYNRVWLTKGSSPEEKLASKVIEYIKKRDVFACIDIHNNTGKNPHYACVSKMDRDHFYLASLFSRTLVYYTSPEQTQSVVLSRIKPALTLEAGQSGNPLGTDLACRFIDSCLHLDHFPKSNQPLDIDLYETKCRIIVKDDVQIRSEYDEFSVGEKAVYLRPDLDALNFVNLPKGTSIGRSTVREPFSLWAAEGQKHEFSRYFEVVGEQILTRGVLVPSMFTLNHDVIRQDCLGYLMQPKEYEL